MYIKVAVWRGSNVHKSGCLAGCWCTSQWLFGGVLGVTGVVVRLDDQGPGSWRPTIVEWRQFSQSNRHSTIGTRQTVYHEALPSSANDEVRCDCTIADDGNAS